MNKLIWCKYESWQEWINSQEIELGQPMLKSDKSSLMLELEDRCNYITYAHPRLQGFDREKRRYYLPLNLNQVLDFIISLDKDSVPTVQYRKNNVHIKIRSKVGTIKHDVQGKTWHASCAKLIKELFDAQT